MSMISEGIAGWWDQEHATTARVIAAMPEGQENFHPHERSMGASELAWHIATTEAMVVQFMMTGSMDPSAQPPPAPDTFQGITDWKNKVHKQSVEQFRTLSDNQLMEFVDFFGHVMPRMGLVNFLLGHEIHHRGQLSVYIRLSGGKVPSIYGNSADTK